MSDNVIGPRSCVNTFAALTKNHLCVKGEIWLPLSVSDARAVQGSFSSQRSKAKLLKLWRSIPDLTAIVVLFQDKTALSFDLDPVLIAYPELSDWENRKLARYQTLATTTK